MSYATAKARLTAVIEATQPQIEGGTPYTADPETVRQQQANAMRKCTFRAVSARRGSVARGNGRNTVHTIQITVHYPRGAYDFDTVAGSDAETLTEAIEHAETGWPDSGVQALFVESASHSGNTLRINVRADVIT